MKNKKKNAILTVCWAVLGMAKYARHVYILLMRYTAEYLQDVFTPARNVLVYQHEKNVTNLKIIRMSVKKRVVGILVLSV